MAVSLTKHILQRSCLPGLVLVNPFQQSVRTTVVVSRMYEPKLYKHNMRAPHFRPRMRKRDQVYIIDEVKHVKPAGNMDLILTIDVEGIGFRGDVVNVTKKVGRNFLLPSGAGIYTSPENLEKWEEIRKEEEAKRDVQKSTSWELVTKRKLSHMNLPIGMNPDNPWTLNKTHVKVAFRRVGVFLTEETITLPTAPVTEVGDIKLKVTINGIHETVVAASVFHIDPMEPDVLPAHLPPVWNHPQLSLTDSIMLAQQQQKNAS